MRDSGWQWYLLGALLASALIMAGTAIAVAYIESHPLVVEPAEEVTHKAEVPVRAPESPVEAPKTEEVLGAIEEQDEGVVPTSPRRQKRRRPERPRMDINLESDDPLEGI